ncbi:hypothetical protein AGMMS50230_20560 [Spirochaetia bacterium]|nr:hypothetical protein AGMMS50230_20560 [Spirochaetia bacterium]
MKNMTRKTRFIKNLSFLSSDEKEKVISFFTKYPVYESRIDWNNKALAYQDFEKVFTLAENSRKNIRRKSDTNPLVLFEKHNCRIICQESEFIIVSPLDWECAIFFNSFDCGGEGAKWCIGDKSTCSYWDSYINEQSIFYLVYFIRKHPVYGKKIIVQYDTETDKPVIWFQNGEGYLGLLEVLELLHYRKSMKILTPHDRVNLWYCYLSYENKIERQLFFDFDLFDHPSSRTKCNKQLRGGG